MIIAFIAIGMVFGALVSGFSLFAGGSFLMALAIYGGVGFTVAALAVVSVLIASGLREDREDWASVERRAA